MFENLRILYSHYGGSWTILKSTYFWIAVLLALMSFSSVVSASWAEKTLSAMPSLTGFTIAAFALVFAVLDEDLLKKLLPVDTTGTSPLLTVASSLAHATVVQITALLVAYSFATADIQPAILALQKLFDCVNWDFSVMAAAIAYLATFWSAVGLLCSYYGFLLVVAAMLSLLRMMVIVAANRRN